MTAPREVADELNRCAGIALEELSGLEPGQHEVCASHSSELRAVYEHDDFSVSASNATALYGVRSIVDGRLGFATTNSDRPEALRGAAREAQRVARFSTPSDHHHIAAQGGSGEYEELCDSQLLTLAPDDVYAYLARVVEEARGDDRVALDRAEFTWSIDTEVLLNSANVRGSAARASCSWFAMGMGRSGDEVTSFDYDGSHTARYATMDDEIARSIGALRGSLLGSLGAKTGETYRGKVLLHPYAVLDLLGSIVQANCNGLSHIDGITPWKDRVGEKVASDLLTIVEEPRNRDMASWAPFDREGIPTQRHALIDGGTLGFVAHNCYSASRAGVAPTGNAQGDPDSVPHIGFSNLVVSAGNRGVSESELASTLGDGLVVKRFSGNTDVVSGHFSGTAKNSWWLKGGQRSHAVSEVMIAGNLFDVLKQIVAVGDELHSLFGAARAPYVLVDGVSVTAA